MPPPDKLALFFLHPRQLLTTDSGSLIHEQMESYQILEIDRGIKNLWPLARVKSLYDYIFTITYLFKSI